MRRSQIPRSPPNTAGEGATVTGPRQLFRSAPNRPMMLGDRSGPLAHRGDQVSSKPPIRTACCSVRDNIQAFSTVMSS